MSMFCFEGLGLRLGVETDSVRPSRLRDDSSIGWKRIRARREP